VRLLQVLAGAKVFVSDTTDYAGGTNCGEPIYTDINSINVQSRQPSSPRHRVLPEIRRRVECATVPVGRFVTVEHHDEFLNICEAEVFGTPLSPSLSRAGIITFRYVLAWCTALAVVMMKN
jgi:hypothetical protein